MKIIFKIARAELRNLFFSPVAWITIVAFFTVSGINFVTPLMDAARIQQVNIENGADWHGFPGPLTFKMFISTLITALSYIFLFIPLLTMGTINRELQSGTMKLLSSSPVGIREIVLGKFLGLLIFNLVLLSSIALLLFTGYFTIEHAEFNWFLSMLLGLFLYSSSFIAIGIFISSLTSYQIVAGIASFIVFFAFNMIGSLWQQYDILRDITLFLALPGRAEFMLSGLITTRELIYFVLLIALFLGLTMIRLKSNQESKSWKVSMGRYLGLITIVLILGYFSIRPGYVGYLDVTRGKINTLDTGTQSVFKEMDGSPLTITLYTNLLGMEAENGMPAGRNMYVWGFWEQFRRFYPNMEFKYVYYYEVRPKDSLMFFKSNPGMTIPQMAAMVAKLYKVDTADFLKPGEVGKLADFSREDELNLKAELEYKGKKTFLRMLTDPKVREPVAGAIRRLTREKAPSVLFTTGHYERSPWRNGEREYGSHTNFQFEFRAMINRGIDADTISLQHQPVPDHTNILVVADPKSELTAIEQERILQFIEKGGNVIFYAEPGKQQMLNPVLKKIGVHINDGILVSPGKHRAPDYFSGVMNKAGNYMARERAMQVYQKDGHNPAISYFFGSSVLNYTDTAGFKYEPIINAEIDGEAWIEKGVFISDSAAPVFNPMEKDEKKTEYVLGLRATRKINNKEQRIVVTGDADFMSRTNSSGGGIQLGIYSWLMYNDYPVYEDLYFPKDVNVTIGKNAAQILWYVYVYIIPGALFLLGSVILIRRRRK